MSSLQSSTSQNENEKGYLFAFDFDHTVVNENSDTYINRLAPPIPKEVKAVYNGTNWTEYMGKVFEYLASQGVTIEEISKCVQGMEPTAGMIKLLKALVQVKTDSQEISSAAAKENLKSSPPIHILIISDANDLFITDFLKAQVLSDSSPNLNNAVNSSTAHSSPSSSVSSSLSTFQFPFDIITNKASVSSIIKSTAVVAATTTTAAPSQNGNNNEQEGPEEISKGTSIEPLSITPFENQSSCKICPKNLCKGGAILKYIEEKGGFTRVFYTGDGSNDICPAVKLSQHDYVFVRKNFRMHKKLEQSSDNLGITANIVIWEDANLIESTIFENVLRDKI